MAAEATTTEAATVSTTAEAAAVSTTAAAVTASATTAVGQDRAGRQCQKRQDSERYE